MTEQIKNTQTYKASSATLQSMLTGPMLTGFIQTAVGHAREIGYDAWTSDLACTKELIKNIVKEIIEA